MTSLVDNITTTQAMAPKREFSQLETPQKNKVTGAAEFCKAMGIKYTKTALARHFKVSRKQVDYALNSQDLRTGRCSEPKKDNPRKLTERDLDHVELFLVENGREGHELTWDELAAQFEYGVTGETLRLNMAPRRVFTFIAAEKPQIDERLAKLRVEWATHMLQRYPEPEDWHHVRWTDEVYFGWGPQGKIHVIRHRGRDWQGHPDCVHRKETKDRNNDDDNKRIHFWAAVGYNFKSPLIRYEVPTNNNGKMSHRVYIDSILEPIVSQWCKEDGQWAMEEDGDPGHGKGLKSNPVSQWKEAHDISNNPSSRFRSFFNCPQSPDFAPIEDTWSYPKGFVRRRPHWTDPLVEELAREAWDQIPQDWINELVDTMPQRLRDCISSGGQMVVPRRCK